MAASVDEESASVRDLIIVRFCTRPWYWMRVGHYTLDAWLIKCGIDYIQQGQKVYFELPEEMKRYERITESLSPYLRTHALQIKRMLSAVQWTRMAKAHQPLTPEEYSILIEAGVQVII